MTMRRAIAIALLLVAPVALGDLVQDLLALPVPRPGMVQDPPEEPPDDAPLDQLAGFWALPMQQDKIPGDKVSERLVEVIDKRPDLLPSIVNFLPARADVCRAVQPAAENANVANWMLLHCESERETLAAYALTAMDDDRGYVSGMEDVGALAFSDPARAEPVLLQLAASPQPNTRALAITYLYRITQSDEYLRALQSIAADPVAAETAREWAIDALAAAKWDGRDEWLLQLLAGGSVPELERYTAAAMISGSDADHWIPIYVRLLDSPNQAARTLAANTLGMFNLNTARADALRPLLPWLSNPGWIEDFGMVRLRIVQSVARLGMTDAIPGLLWVLEHESDDTIRSYAAEALGELHDPRGNDTMRKLIETMESNDDRARVIAALDADGGYAAIELARGLEAAVALALARDDRADFMMYDATEHFPAEVMIGFRVLSSDHDRDDVARMVVRRAEEIRRDQPELSEELIGVVETWPVPAANELFIARMLDGSASADEIASAIESREFIRTSPPALGRLRAAGGAMAGIVAILIGDSAGERRILAGHDIEEQRGLLAAARLAREELPVADVADLFGRTPLLDDAAEAFLAHEKDAAAESLVRARHPGELVIRGWGGDSDWEEEMTCRFLASDAAELIALKRNALDVDDATVLAIQVTSRGAASPESAQDIVTLVAASHFDDLEPIEIEAPEGAEYEYLHLTRGGGRRVMMTNPMYAPGSPYEELVRRINALVPEDAPPVIREPLLLR